MTYSSRAVLRLVFSGSNGAVPDAKNHTVLGSFTACMVNAFATRKQLNKEALALFKLLSSNEKQTCVGYVVEHGDESWAVNIPETIIHAIPSL